jgi:hypothetical protein
LHLHLNKQKKMCSKSVGKLGGTVCDCILLLNSLHPVNPFTASCENAMTLSVPGIPASCEKFPHSSQLNFSSTESIFYQFSAFLKTWNALCVCLQYKHPRSIKKVIRSDKPVTLLLLFWSHNCDFGAEPLSLIIATSAVKGLNSLHPVKLIASC